MTHKRSTRSAKKRIERRFRKKMNQPSRYNQWSTFILELKFTEDGRMIMPHKSYSEKEMENMRICALMVREAKAGGCAFCGHMHDLVFHHGENRRFNVGYYVGQPYVDPDVIRAEIDKCVVLCVPCHTWLHAVQNRDEYIPNKEPEKSWIYTLIDQEEK
jgi:hypothetical protein